MSISIPEPFHASCLFWNEYPLNIIDKSLYGRRLHWYRRRLLAIAPYALVEAPHLAQIPIIDIHQDLRIDSCEIDDTEKLKEWLGDTFKQSALNPARWVGKPVSKTDPRVRFVFLINPGGSNRLELRLDDLLCLSSYHQVMPDYMDFLSIYGSRKVNAGLRFTALRNRLVCNHPLPGHVIPDMGRSGRRLELCYNLKSAVRPLDLNRAGRWLDDQLGLGDRLRRDEDLGFEIRQTATYHRFDLGTHRSFWMMTDPDSALKDVINHLLRNELAPSEVFTGDVGSSLGDGMRFNLDIHLAITEWATDQWRWYIDRLEDRVEPIV